MNDKLNNNRRDFLKKAGAVAAFGVFASSFAAVINSCEQDEVEPAPAPQTVNIDLKKYPALLTAGGVDKVIATLSDGKTKNWAITRIDETTFAVLDLKCPHAGCTVDIATGGLDFICHCHSVNFKPITGEVVPNSVYSGNGLIKYRVSSFDASNNILKVSV